MIKQHIEDALGKYGLLSKEKKGWKTGSPLLSLQWTKEDKKDGWMD